MADFRGCLQRVYITCLISPNSTDDILVQLNITCLISPISSDDILAQLYIIPISSDDILPNVDQPYHIGATISNLSEKGHVLNHMSSSYSVEWVFI